MCLRSRQFICNEQVVCSTCTGAGDEKRLQSMRFRQVIIDEATQATEPAVLIPLVGAQAS